MTIIKPTVGRVVWYYPGAYDHVARNGDQPHRADIVSVHGDRCVNLAVNDANGMAYQATSVLLVQPGDAMRPQSGYCEWMPYQIGQAAKHEQAQADATCPSVCDECPTDDAAPSGQAVDIHMPSIKSGVIFTGNGVNVHFERY